MHYRARAKYKIEVEDEIWKQSKAQKIKPVKNPVILQFIFTFNNKRKRDYDNYAPKFINDGLRKSGIIPEDNSEVITAINLSFKQGQEDLTEIYIQELI